MREKVFESVANQIMRQIELGIFRKGDRLPSCRDYGASEGINPNTVQRAYLLLEERGYIEIFQNKGAYVLTSFEKDSVSKKLREEIVRYKLLGVEQGEFLKIVEEVFKE